MLHIPYDHKHYINYNYPTGSEYDTRAPWNRPDIETDTETDNDYGKEYDPDEI